MNSIYCLCVFLFFVIKSKVPFLNNLLLKTFSFIFFLFNLLSIDFICQKLSPNLSLVFHKRNVPSLDLDLKISQKHFPLDPSLLNLNFEGMAIKNSTILFDKKALNSPQISHQVI